MSHMNYVFITLYWLSPNINFLRMNSRCCPSGR